jgi:hypothetical protein
MRVIAFVAKSGPDKAASHWWPIYLLMVSIAVLLSVVFLPVDKSKSHVGSFANFMIIMMHVIPVLIAMLTFTCLIRNNCQSWKYILMTVVLAWVVAFFAILYKLYSLYTSSTQSNDNNTPVDTDTDSSPIATRVDLQRPINIDAHRQYTNVIVVNSANSDPVSHPPSGSSPSSPLSPSDSAPSDSSQSGSPSDSSPLPLSTPHTSGTPHPLPELLPEASTPQFISDPVLPNQFSDVRFLDADFGSVSSSFGSNESLYAGWNSNDGV